MTHNKSSPITGLNPCSRLSALFLLPHAALMGWGVAFRMAFVLVVFGADKNKVGIGLKQWATICCRMSIASVKGYSKVFFTGVNYGGTRYPWF